MSYSFTGDSSTIFIDLAFLSLLHFYIIQQSLLKAVTGSKDNKSPSRK